MRTITLTAEQTAAYEDSGEIGDRMRRAEKARAQAMANEIGSTVEIAAAEGYILDVRQPEVQSCGCSAGHGTTSE